MDPVTSGPTQAGCVARLPGPEAQPRPRASPLGHGRQALAGDGQSVGQVRGEQPGIAEPFANAITRGAVQVDPQSSRVVGGQTLGQECPDRPGQDVAGTAGRKRRIFEWRNGHGPAGFRRRDDGPGALEHDDLAPLRGCIPGRRNAGRIVLGKVA